jgi:hypothetical protein
MLQFTFMQRRLMPKQGPPNIVNTQHPPNIPLPPPNPSPPNRTSPKDGPARR